ncbi:cytochrome P450 93A2-like [Tasmannia lanceolata]|uniref:cytochrome P450 93A2-like n=1 Tax=Tasmannia lanceolata TaxID=3420 RepID=UPI0040627F73
MSLPLNISPFPLIAEAMADLLSFCTLFLVFLLTFLLVRTIFFKSRTKVRLPPSPMSLPILGHLHLLGPLPHQAFYKLSTAYGPLLSLRLGSVSCIVASSPETAKEFLKTHELHFSSRPKNIAVGHLTYGTYGFAFAPYGPYWKFMKKLCVSELLGGRTIDLFEPVRREEIRSFLKVLFEKSKAGEAVNLSRELVRLTSNIVSRMAMSQRCSETEGEADEVQTVVQAVANLVGTFNLADYISFFRRFDLQGISNRLKDVHKRFDVMMERIIREHEEARKAKKMNKEMGGDGVRDILDILLDISEDDKAEIKLRREDIKAFIMDIFVAGTDTSSITPQWALSELINNPTVFEKARKEIDLVVGKSRLVEESDIPNLPYLQAIIKETLRLHPASPISLRECTQDCKIGGYDIPVNSRLFINMWAIGRDPKHWDNPLEFRPERFMPSDENNRSPIDLRGQHYSLLPFGSGRRGCPGATLALQVVHAALAIMIQGFTWKAGNGEGNARVDMEEGAGLTLPRRKPLVCVPVARLHPFPSIDALT